MVFRFAECQIIFSLNKIGNDLMLTNQLHERAYYHLNQLARLQASTGTTGKSTPAG